MIRDKVQYLNWARPFAIIVESVNEDFPVGVVIVDLRKQQVTITTQFMGLPFCRNSHHELYVSRQGLNHSVYVLDKFVLCTSSGPTKTMIKNNRYIKWDI